MKKRLLSLFAAAAVLFSLSSCKPNEAVQEIHTSEAAVSETSAPENTEDTYETLTDGQERDWKIEDVLKNDLEIDGIPISLPCTVVELLDALGKEYSVNESGYIYYNDDPTMLSIITGYGDDADIIHGISFINSSLVSCGKCILSFRGVNDKYEDVINRYPNPRDSETKDGHTTIRYKDETHFFYCIFKEDDLVTIHIEESFEKPKSEIDIYA